MGNAECSVQLAQKCDLARDGLASGAASAQNALAASSYSACHACRSTTGLSDKECADVLLVNAAVRGDVEDLQRALELGASVDTTAELTLTMGDLSKGVRPAPTHVTPLMRAAELGHAGAVERLLRSKATAHQCDSKGWNALCYALGSGQICTARMLAEASPTARAGMPASVLAEVLHRCRREAGATRAAELERELAPGGSLAAPAPEQRSQARQSSPARQGAAAPQQRAPVKPKEAALAPLPAG
ncbi:unnamed protein product [Prorocentrum cordatum]|uniref:Uncharacterized protein n=1 Tax=Prorocentrum cordatum TaxID=2364126 RepID=A0ABN9RBA3_9DINO|nr:unnamed protein product [Polarella glacialis]